MGYAKRYKPSPLPSYNLGMPSTQHKDLTGAELHANKIDPTTGTELTPASLAILDARYGLGGGGSALVPVSGETPAGAINGTNTAFILAYAPAAGSVRLFLNGLRLRPGSGNSYTVSGTTVTLTAAPQPGDELLADYFR